MNKPSFLIPSPYVKLKDKDISKFRIYVEILISNAQEMAYYLSHYENNFDITPFSNIYEEASNTISEIVSTRLISDHREYIDKFKMHFITFSDYFGKIYKDLFENTQNMIPNELFGKNPKDEIDIDKKEKEWKAIFNLLKKKRAIASDQDLDKVDFCYAISMVYQSVNNLTDFYENLPEDITKKELIERIEKYEANEIEYKKRLAEKDEQLDNYIKQIQNYQNELMKSKKQNEKTSRENADLQSEISNLSKNCMENDKYQKELLNQIEDLKSRSNEALENPTPKFNTEDLERVKDRYTTVLQHIRDITLVID